VDLAVKVAIVSATPPTLAALAALFQTRRTKAQLTELHVLINSRLTELLNLTKESAHAEGKLEGQAEGR
jgi:hypothetical protein